METSYGKDFHTPLINRLKGLLKDLDVNCIGIIFPNQGPVGVVQLRGLFAEKISLPTIIIRINERLIRNQVWFERNEQILPPLNQHSKVLLFGDAATSGASIFRAALIARKFGAECSHAFVVFDRLQGAGERLKTKHIKLYSFIDRKILEHRGILDPIDIVSEKNASRFEFESVPATV